MKSGSIVSLPDAHPIAPMRFSVSPVVRQAVSPKNPSQLPKFLVGLRRLHKSEQGLEVIINERTSEYIIAGSGELHIEVALNAFRQLLGDDVQIIVGRPIVEFRETITETSTMICLGKSSNKHNRVHFTAEPLEDDVVKALAKIDDVPNDPKKRYQMLLAAGIPAPDAKKAWCVLLSSRSHLQPLTLGLYRDRTSSSIAQNLCSTSSRFETTSKSPSDRSAKQAHFQESPCKACASSSMTLKFTPIRRTEVELR